MVALGTARESVVTLSPVQHVKLPKRRGTGVRSQESEMKNAF